MAADETTPTTLLELERQLLEPAVRRDPQRIGQLLAPDFIEIGASGVRYDRDHVMRALANETPCQRTTSEAQVQLLADDVALVTFRECTRRTDTGDERWSLRSSIWKRRNGNWQLLFHQGTLAKRSSE